LPVDSTLAIVEKAENKAPSHQHSIHAFGVISFLSHFFSTGLFAIIALQVFNRYLHHHKYRKNSYPYSQQIFIQSSCRRRKKSLFCPICQREDLFRNRYHKPVYS